MEDELLSAFHACLAIAGILTPDCAGLLASATLRNGGPVLLWVFVYSDLLQFGRVANVSVFSCVDELYQN